MPMSPRLLRPRGTFSPRNVSGLVAWYDAADASSLAQNSDGTTTAGSGDPVGYWRDRVGTNHMTQSVNNNRPTLTGSAQNGRSVVRFNGSSHFLANTGFNISAATELSLFAVIKYLAPTVGHQIAVTFGGLQPPTFISAWFGAVGLEINRTGTTVAGFVGTTAGAGGFTGLTGSNAASSSAFTHGVVYASQSGSLRVNGTQVATGSFTSPLTSNNGLRFGSYAAGIQPANVDLCEVAYYSRALTATEISRLQTHWAAKWGL